MRGFTRAACGKVAYRYNGEIELDRFKYFFIVQPITPYGNETINQR